MAACAKILAIAFHSTVYVMHNYVFVFCVACLWLHCIVFCLVLTERHFSLNGVNFQAPRIKSADVQCARDSDGDGGLLPVYM